MLFNDSVLSYLVLVTSDTVKIRYQHNIIQHQNKFFREVVILVYVTSFDG